MKTLFKVTLSNLYDKRTAMRTGRGNVVPYHLTDQPEYGFHWRTFAAFYSMLASHLNDAVCSLLRADFSTFGKVIQCIVENNYSRIPIYADNEDNIKGILYIKDLLPHLNKPASFRWQTLVRQATFVPETKMIDDLLRDFQAQKVHIAIVVDEFGGTSGIVTMEDIIEEIVGEINDEYDEDERSYTRLNQNTYVFEAKTLLSDFRKIMQLPEDAFDDVAGDADTLAGLLLEIKGEFPQEHERIQHDRFTFEVMEMDERRIVKIKVIVGKEKLTEKS